MVFANPVTYIAGDCSKFVISIINIIIIRENVHMVFKEQKVFPASLHFLVTTLRIRFLYININSFI